MKKSIGLILLCLVLQGTALAQLINAKSVSGQVSALKGNMITITNKANHNDLLIELTEETHVFVGSDFKKAGDIHVGDQATAVYREKGNQKTAISITITQ
ncbi:MAG: hypothetical protein HY283_07800 [Nitrospirae bacterium]|nr:hypothetical protein [Nitrospirota bacterium]